MRRENCSFLIVLACISMGSISVAGEVSTNLVGTWDYTSLTALKDGKPFGTVHFKPGQWTLKLNADGTYLMKAPSPPAKPEGVNGTYKVHGHDLSLSPANSSQNLQYHFDLKQDGKVLELKDKDKGSIISATRE